MSGFLHPSIIYLPEWTASIELQKIGPADEQEMMALKAVLFCSDAMIPAQSHGCDCSENQLQVQDSL